MSGDLRRFQDMPQAQANLSQVQAAQPPATTGLEQALGFVEGFGAPVMQARNAFVDAQAEVAEVRAVGGLTNTLVRIQQAGQTDPSVNVQQAQRKAYTEWAAANQDLAGEGLKAFSDATGIKVAGLSFEQKEQQDLQEAAWSAGFGSPTATPEENAKQLELHQNIKRESKVMEFEAKKQGVSDATRKKAVFAGTAKLATWKTESLQATLDTDIQALKNGADRNVIMAKWAKLKIDWSNELAGYGEFANDPTIKAQLSGVESMFALSDRMVSGEAELEAITTDSKIAVAKQEAMLSATPEGARLIATAKNFGNVPSAAVAMSNYVSDVLSKPATEAADPRNVVGAEAKTVQESLKNMASGEDGEAKEQASTQISQMAKHLDRNGEDYTDDQIFQTCSILDTPEAFKNMSNDQTNTVVRACETYAVDVAGRAIREIETGGTITFVGEGSISPRGEFVPGDRRELPVQSYATIMVDSNGISYAVKDEYRNSRQVRRQVQQLNKQFAKVNPVLSILSKATGQDAATVAADMWRIGPVAEERAAQAQSRANMDVLTGEMTERMDIAPQQPLSATERQELLSLSDSPVESIVEELPTSEGVGDNVTATPTGALGVTPAAMAAVGAQGNPEDLSLDEARQISRQYLTQLSEGFQQSIDGYENLSAEAQTAVLDAAYNLGPSIANFPAFSAAVAAGDEQEAVKQLLDTANAEGKSVKGIAKRRAEQYNKVADVPVTSVTQQEDGTILYLDADDNVIFQYTPRGGRHATSAAGTIAIN